MKIKELREKIAAAGGKVGLGNGAEILCKSTQDDIDLEMRGIGMVAWVKNDKDEDEDVEKGLSIMSGTFQIGTLVAFAQYIGMEVGEVKPIVVEKQVVVSDVRMSADLSKARDDWQRSENERGAEKRAYQWVVSELADKLRG